MTGSVQNTQWSQSAPCWRFPSTARARAGAFKRGARTRRYIPLCTSALGQITAFKQFEKEQGSRVAAC